MSAVHPHTAHTDIFTLTRRTSHRSRNDIGWLLHGLAPIHLCILTLHIIHRSIATLPLTVLYIPCRTLHCLYRLLTSVMALRSARTLSRAVRLTPALRYSTPSLIPTTSLSTPLLVSTLSSRPFALAAALSDYKQPPSVIAPPKAAGGGNVEDFFTKRSTGGDNSADYILTSVDALINYCRSGSFWSATQPPHSRCGNIFHRLTAPCPRVWGYIEY